jgi:hypothetical protein
MPKEMDINSSPVYYNDINNNNIETFKNLTGNQNNIVQKPEITISKQYFKLPNGKIVGYQERKNLNKIGNLSENDFINWVKE